eukprot:Em0001g1801a
MANYTQPTAGNEQHTSSEDEFERPLPVHTDESKDEEMDFGEESELEDLIEEIREQSNESYYPFPSKIFALLYLLVNSPHPMCLGRPDIAGNLVRYPIQKEGTYTELFHGSRWHTDLRFYSPMVMLADETSVFVNDCVSFYHPTLGSVSGKVTKFFHQSDSITEVYARIDMLLDLRQFQRMVPDTTVMHLHSDTLIHAGQVVVPTNSIHGIATPPSFLVRWIAPVNFVRMDEEEEVLVVAPVLCIVCDNPMASKLCNHLGSSALKYCRLCMVDRTGDPYVICEKRCKCRAVEQMSEIKAQRTEDAKIEKRKEYGLREDDNPLLDIPADIYDDSLPVEVLHTLGLGACKYLLKETMPTLRPWQKREILARVRAFNTSGFRVKMYGNVCQYYQSFLGRDFKAWAQMAIFILKPYLNEGQAAVWLSFSKLFQIAYCEFFDASKAAEWQSVCQGFVDAVKQHMPSLLQKPKTHMILHLVQCMKELGPSSAFSAESCGDALQELFSCKYMSHIMCGIPIKELQGNKGIYQPGSPRKAWHQRHSLQSLPFSCEGNSNATIENLQGFTVALTGTAATEEVVGYGAIVSQDSSLVNCGDYIQLVTQSSQIQYGILLAVLRTSSGTVLCLVQGFDSLQAPGGQTILNEYDCPLLELSKRIFTTSCHSIQSPVSVVHECSTSCVVQQGSSAESVEREEVIVSDGLNHSTCFVATRFARDVEYVFNTTISATTAF